MSELPNCPKCGESYTYEDGHLYVCPMCAHEWSAADAETAEGGLVVRDANGNLLQDGDFVTIGHGAIVHASTLEDNVLVGMGAIVLSGCHIGTGSIIAAGAVVLENTTIPPYSLVVGVPAKVVRTDESQVERIHNQALKYKNLWTERYGLLPNAGGEEYKKGAKIV